MLLTSPMKSVVPLTATLPWLVRPVAPVVPVATTPRPEMMPVLVSPCGESTEPPSRVMRPSLVLPVPLKTRASPAFARTSPLPMLFRVALTCPLPVILPALFTVPPPRLVFTPPSATWPLLLVVPELNALSFSASTEPLSMVVVWVTFTV
ncbi:MAG: hypothetical protein COW73_02070 [Nitrospirae bacterium CG18_big_fil_WC_8_21_14_2_50_70_55]|nr:MAG: hypothetical protein COW73_02070 [Nitrospirae bacterium CG18_big_fil_WC_8_21_14_2_50_70_55]